MRIILAEYAGFCFGVKKAIQLAQNASQKSSLPVYTYGPLIHNPQLVAKLEEEGIKVINNLNDVDFGHLIIRSHGVGPKTISEMETKFKISDATCPFVAKAQKIAQELYQKGYQVIILGSKTHPEVIGLQEWTDNQAIVIENSAEIEKLNLDAKVALIAQTTQNLDLFNEVEKKLRSKAHEVVTFNTICTATKKRQEAAAILSKNVDIMVVVGGKNSANTNKLVDVCKKNNTITYHIESAKEIQPYWFNNKNTIGVTAGASTPDWIIEEVIHKMAELNEKEVLEVSKEKQEDITPQTAINENELQQVSEVKAVHKGDIIEGKVIEVKENEIIIDFGGKSEGIIPILELSVRNVSDPLDIVRIGDLLKVMVIQEENSEGQPVFSKKRADRVVAWEYLQEAMNNNQEISAVVMEVVKGGVLVDVGIRGFVPASLLERGYVENLDTYLGKTLRLKVIEIDQEKGRVVLSQKIILDEEYEKKQKALWNTLAIGDIKKGIVRRLTNFGAFVDIGGVEGLLHVSELAWSRVKHPSDILTEEQEIEVKIIGLDKEKQKISLSLKDLLPDPWSTVATKYPLGSIVTGKVLRTVPFGAFVELEPGVEGLVHISQLAYQHVEKTEDVVNVGDKVRVKILNADVQAKKISLSIKQTEDVIAEETKEDIANSYQTSDKSLTLGDVFGDLFTKKPNE